MKTTNKTTNLLRRAVCALLCLIVFASCLTACGSKPPALEDIRERVEQLITDSYEINCIFFGEGLETYPRLYDPKSTTAVLNTTAVNEKGETVERKVWYYYPHDAAYTIVAYRDSYVKPFRYAVALKAPATADQLRSAFPENGEKNDEFYTCIYEDAAQSIYCYRIPYTETSAEFYYTTSDLADYNYVTFDNKYTSIKSIQDAAAKVYSTSYLRGIYTMAFDGYASEFSDEVTTARYLEHEGNLLRFSSGNSDPFNILPGERRYLMDTMEIVRPSSATYINIKIDSYLVGDEQNILPITLHLVLQDGQWFLDSPTY